MPFKNFLEHAKRHAKIKLGNAFTRLVHQSSQQRVKTPSGAAYNIFYTPHGKTMEIIRLSRAVFPIKKSAATKQELLEAIEQNARKSGFENLRLISNPKWDEFLRKNDYVANSLSSPKGFAFEKSLKHEK